MDDKQYNKADQTLQTLIAHKEEANKALSMMLKIRYQIETNNKADATITCVEMASMFEQIKLQNQPTTIINELHDEIKQLVGSFIEVNVDSSLLLQRCRFDLIIGSFEGLTRLLKLRIIGIEMQSIAEKMQKQRKSVYFKGQYSLMDSILKEMQKIDNVDLKAKCKEIACFLKYYGYCCAKARDFDKAIEVYAQAISSLERTYGNDEAKNLFVLGLCYNNLGNAYHNLHKLVEAKLCYETALKIYSQVKDWTDNKQKINNILLATNNLDSLQRLETKLKSKKN